MTCEKPARFQPKLLYRRPRSPMVFLSGEWVSGWLGMSITFLVAVLGVTGLGWWVLRGDKINRAAEEVGEVEPHEGEH